MEIIELCTLLLVEFWYIMIVCVLQVRGNLQDDLHVITGISKDFYMQKSLDCTDQPSGHLDHCLTVLFQVTTLFLANCIEGMGLNLLLQ